MDGRDAEHKNRGGGRPPLFLWLVTIFHAVWFLLYAGRILTETVSGAVPGFHLEHNIFGLPGVLFVGWSVCVGFGSILVGGFVILSLLFFWTWAYRKTKGWPKRGKMPLSPVRVFGRMPAGLVVAMIFGGVCVLVVALTGFLVCAALFEMCFVKDHGAGPLIGVLIWPLVFGLSVGAVVVAGLFAAGLVYMYFASRRMVEYIGETLIPVRDA